MNECRKKQPQIALPDEHDNEKKGEYIIIAKVIDILGNDTPKAVEVKAG